MARSAAVLPAVTFALSFAFAYGPEALRMSLPAALAVSAAAAAVVWLSGRRPGAALAAVVALAVALPVLRSTFQGLDLVVVLAVFRAAADPRLRPVLPAAAGLVALTVNDVWQRVALDSTFATPGVLLPALLTALAVGLGLQTRRVRAQHAELLALREADRHRAVSEERRRIARDLHDVAAHHLTAVVVRTKVASRVGTVEALTEATGFAARTAGDALDSMRQVVRVLATGDEPPTPPPGAADLPDTLDRMEAAGLRVERGELDLAGLPGEVGVAVLRIAQEALANVLRHRGPGRCRVAVRRSGGAVELTVQNDGPATGSPRAGGYGLIGMRERAESCGGHLTAGPSPHGGWTVRAVLPLSGAPSTGPAGSPSVGPGALPVAGS